MRRMWFLTFSTAMLASANFAAAQAPDLFASLDTNKDGFISADEVPAEKVKLFERLVRANDKNGDGKLTAEEFKASSDTQLKTAVPGGAGAPGGGDRPSPAEMIKRIDGNGDGKISREEAPQRLKENFDRVDADGNGSLDLAELERVAKFLGGGPPGGPPGSAPAPAAEGDVRAKAEELFKKADGNGDGKLSLDEVPEEKRADFQKALDRFDEDKDGALTREQAIIAIARIALGGKAEGKPEGGKEDPAAVFAKHDSNNDGKLTRDEIPEEHREDFAKALKRFDDDGDGALNREQFAQALRTLKGEESGSSAPRSAGETPRPSFVPPLFKALDLDGNGELSTDEVAKASASLKQLDRDGDGKITLRELGPVPGATSNSGGPPAGGEGRMAEELGRRLKAADRNGDGKLQRDEVPQPLAGMFEKADTDGDGAIDEAELRKAMTGMRALLEQGGGEELREKIKAFREKLEAGK